MATPLTLNSGRGSDGIPLLVATGEIDLSNVDTFTQAITRTITDADGADAVVIDLSAVEYLDSAAINALAVHADDVGRMRLIAHPFLMPVLTISGLTELAEVEAAQAQPGVER
ncbi:STAS domain-containing protein [Mycolicibacterium sp. S2-37]|uniref:STAS domain-containing protein n=1 Tax=Mycolicibacterium sp. S2-37 TaxID=2810297 RepID=UPI001A95004E|nr:STAS domain-containing protein [Mycolicibacterium sp. S2-37]MBO0678390.1 STAS domain-containing protein [Mycolicibacterium sp. S2-37]